MEFPAVFSAEEGSPPPLSQVNPNNRRSISILNSLRSFPAKRAVIYSICALTLGTVITLFNMFINFLSELAANDRVWNYLSDKSLAFQNMSQQLQLMDAAATQFMQVFSNSTPAKIIPTTTTDNVRVVQRGKAKVAALLISLLHVCVCVSLSLFDLCWLHLM